MYSGSDSTESQNYTQWALNPTAYQNVANENVDWAALAQQWIIMKEAGPPVPEQIAPPAPNIGNKLKKESLNEGGEAPMDVENEKEDPPNTHWNENTGSSTNEPWNWNQQSQWGWNNTWTPSGVPPPNSAIKPPLLPTPPYKQYNSQPDLPNEGGKYGYNSVPPQNDFTTGYWTAAGSSKMKSHSNKRYSKVNVPRPPVAPETVALDAAKRKQLPAWIREGLEKMERDKQKQLEKERERQDKVEFKKEIKLSEKDTLEIIKSTVEQKQKGKFESDEEISEDERDTKSSFKEEIVPITQEELMLKVRRTMTEILLNVTNREIELVCREELQRYNKKLKASDDRVSAPSGANLSAKLGLGMYGNSGSSSDDSETDLQEDGPDSDAELKNTIRKRKAEFSRTEREIEDRLALTERRAESDSRPGTPEVTDKDSQVDAKSQGRNKSKHSSNNSKDHTPPPKQVQTTKRKPYRSSSSSSGSDSEYEKKNAKNNSKSKRHHSVSSDSSNGRRKSWRSRSSSLDYKKSKHKDEIESSKLSSQSRRSRTRSPKNRRTRSRSKSSKRSRYSRRSRSRSRSRSRRSNSRYRYKSSRSYRSRSRSQSYSRSHGRSRSRRRSNSSSRHTQRRRRSSSSSRGKRSRR